MFIRDKEFPYELLYKFLDNRITEDGIILGSLIPKRQPVPTSPEELYALCEEKLHLFSRNERRIRWSYLLITSFSLCLITFKVIDYYRTLTPMSMNDIGVLILMIALWGISIAFGIGVYQVGLRSIFKGHNAMKSAYSEIQELLTAFPEMCRKDPKILGWLEELKGLYAKRDEVRMKKLLLEMMRDEV